MLEVRTDKETIVFDAAFWRNEDGYLTISNNSRVIAGFNKGCWNSVAHVGESTSTPTKRFVFNFFK